MVNKKIIVILGDGSGLCITCYKKVAKMEVVIVLYRCIAQTMPSSLKYMTSTVSSIYKMDIYWQ